MRPTLSFLPGETALPLPLCPLKSTPFDVSHPQRSPRQSIYLTHQAQHCPRFAVCPAPPVGRCSSDDSLSSTLSLFRQAFFRELAVSCASCRRVILHCRNEATNERVVTCAHNPPWKRLPAFSLYPVSISLPLAFQPITAITDCSYASASP